MHKRRRCIAYTRLVKHWFVTVIVLDVFLIGWVIEYILFTVPFNAYYFSGPAMPEHQIVLLSCCIGAVCLLTILLNWGQTHQWSARALKACGALLMLCLARRDTDDQPTTRAPIPGPLRIVNWTSGSAWRRRSISAASGCAQMT
jgi:hypothetical protein